MGRLWDPVLGSDRGAETGLTPEGVGGGWGGGLETRAARGRRGSAPPPRPPPPPPPAPGGTREVGLPSRCWRWARPGAAGPGKGDAAQMVTSLSGNARRCRGTGMRAQLCTFPGPQGPLGSLPSRRDGVPAHT